MTLIAYRKWLIGIWALGFLIPFVLVLSQFGSGKYGEKFEEALGWLTALTLPTILLMIGVLIANPANAAVPENPAHDKFVFRLAAGVSVLYLLIVNLVFFYEPFAVSKPQELMRDSKIFLAIFDSLISLGIGYFFGKK